jgi:branched-chain amino acid transport system ATP-binding protein
VFTLHNITAGYGSTVVLRDVSLAVPAASVVALLGPNGAGKTTLLRVASGLLAPFEGDLRIDGTSVASDSPHQLVRRGACHVPEGRGVFSSLTVRDNLTLFAPARGADAADRAVDAFPRLGERLDQVAGTLSGGEQQMLALARAYVQSPQFVFLDEVSLGLAPVIIDELYAFLARLAAEGVALLLVEQYAERALAVADYVYILSRGQIEFAGEPAELAGADLLRYYLPDSS